MASSLRYESSHLGIPKSKKSNFLSRLHFLLWMVLRPTVYFFRSMTQHFLCTGLSLSGIRFMLSWMTLNCREEPKRTLRADHFRSGTVYAGVLYSMLRVIWSCTYLRYILWWFKALSCSMYCIFHVSLINILWHLDVSSTAKMEKTSDNER